MKVGLIRGRLTSEFWDNVYNLAVSPKWENKGVEGGNAQEFEMFISKDRMGDFVATGSSFERRIPGHDNSLPGLLMLMSSYSELLSVDKEALLRKSADKIYVEGIASAAAIDRPNLLYSTVVLAYADVKSFRFHMLIHAVDTRDH